jgi:hypothetical protein
MAIARSNLPKSLFCLVQFPVFVGYVSGFDLPDVGLHPVELLLQLLHLVAGFLQVFLEPGFFLYLCGISLPVNILVFLKSGEKFVAFFPEFLQRIEVSFPEAVISFPVAVCWFCRS